MRTENIEVNITIPIPFDKPDKNGVIYTKEAVEKAVNNLHKNLPILYSDDDMYEEVPSKYNKKVIGTTKGNSHIATWDFENQVCKVTIEGELLFGGTECLYEVEDGKVTDFQIIGIGLSK